MTDEHERHFKKTPKKPWVLELHVTMPEGLMWAGKTFKFKSYYQAERFAQQAEPEHYERWAKLGIKATTKIYKKP